MMLNQYLEYLAIIPAYDRRLFIFLFCSCGERSVEKGLNPAKYVFIDDFGRIIYYPVWRSVPRSGPQKITAQAQDELALLDSERCRESKMKASNLLPIPALRPYVKNIWVVESDGRDRHEKMIPYGCMDLVYIHQNGLIYQGKQPKELKENEIFLTGQVIT
ncbi:MAG: DUF6597 domain-containing transcriptional factor, partial [Bacteroidota bacterium]